MSTLRLLVLLAFAGALSACNVSGNITDMTVRNSTVSVGQLTGIESGAHAVTTSGGYQIQAALGDPISAIMATTAGGYTVYSNVQGNMASQVTVTTTQ